MFGSVQLLTSGWGVCGLYLGFSATWLSSSLCKTSRHREVGRCRRRQHGVPAQQGYNFWRMLVEEPRNVAGQHLSDVRRIWHIDVQWACERIMMTIADIDSPNCVKRWKAHPHASTTERRRETGRYLFRLSLQFSWLIRPRRISSNAK